MLQLQSALRHNTRPAPGFLQVRRSSTVDLVKIEKDLISRRLPLLYGTLTPQPSYLLDLTLRDFLASSPFPAPTREGLQSKPYPLPPGHHLIYFPNPTTASQLLPDGTDTLHSPPPPFGQRLWAGGRVQFKKPSSILLNNRPAVLVERIRDVRVTGKAGFEKIFVGIERRISDWARGEEAEHAIRQRVLKDSEEDLSDALVLEKRDLCFLRDDNPASSTQPTKPTKILAPPTNPTFTFAFTPTPALLFRFSALTFNAHAIHIDPDYTLNVYGLPNLLVHGPLCLTIMLECLSRAIRKDDTELQRSSSFIKEISYRNFKPVFVNEEMRVCGKLKAPYQEAKNAEWDVWIETGEGDRLSLAVRGTAITAEGADH